MQRDMFFIYGRLPPFPDEAAVPAKQMHSAYAPAQSLLHSHHALLTALHDTASQRGKDTTMTGISAAAKGSFL